MAADDLILNTRIRTWCADVDITYTHRAKAAMVVSILDPEGSLISTNPHDLGKYIPLEALPAFVLEYLDWRVPPTNRQPKLI